MTVGYVGHRGIRNPDGSTDEGWVRFTCGHCGTAVSGAVVARHVYEKYPGTRVQIEIEWVLCPACALGSTIINGQAYPGASFGPAVQGLPSDVEMAYTEARQCMKVSAHTSAELICRKILMHVAVEKGAKEGETFAAYISYLEGQGYITPPMKKWVQIIRTHGNQSTHRLQSPTKEHAESTVMFTAELLRLVYEMEHMAAQFAPEKATDS